MGKNATRLEINELRGVLPDESLTYLALEATRAIKRRFSRGEGRGFGRKVLARGNCL